MRNGGTKMQYFIRTLLIGFVVVCVGLFINGCQTPSPKISGGSENSTMSKETTLGTICTGPKTGTYYHYANGIIDAAKNALNIQLSNLSTVGTQENALKMASGECCMAIVQEDIYYQAGSQFNQFVANKGTIAALYKEPVHIIVNKNSGIHSVSDLAGKKVNVGEEESGTLITANMILNILHKVDPEPDYYFDPPEKAVLKVCDGTYDAAFYVAAIPIPALSNLPKDANITMIPATIPLFSFQYDVGTIPAETYPWLEHNIYENIEMRSLLSVGPEIDRQMIPKFLNIMFEKKDQYSDQYHLKWKNFSKKFNVEAIKDAPNGWNREAVYYYAEKPIPAKKPQPFFCSDVKDSMSSRIVNHLIPIVNSTMGVSLTEKQTNGPLDNIRMLYDGECSMGIVQQDVYGYLLSRVDKTNPNIQDPMLMFASLAQIMPVYKQDLHVIVNNSSGIRTLNDIKGKRVNLGYNDSGTLATAKTILMTNGIRDVTSFFYSPDIAMQKLIQGNLDAIFLIDQAPSQYITNATCPGPEGPTIPGCVSGDLKTFPLKILRVRGTELHDHLGVLTSSMYPFMERDIKRVPQISSVVVLAPGVDDSHVSDFIQSVYQSTQSIQDNDLLKNISIEAGERFFKRVPNYFNYKAALFYLEQSNALNSQ